MRRSPTGNIAITLAAPRLACVKPAASVHPEPGSNSPLYKMCLFRSFAPISKVLFEITLRREWINFAAQIPSKNVVQYIAIRTLFSLVPYAPRGPYRDPSCFIEESGCKGKTFFRNNQLFSKLFSKTFRLSKKTEPQELLPIKGVSLS